MWLTTRLLDLIYDHNWERIQILGPLLPFILNQYRKHFRVFFLLFEVKLSYDLVCLSVGHLADRTVSLNFLKREGEVTLPRSYRSNCLISAF